MIFKVYTLKKFYTFLGSFFVLIGIIGLFLPIFPTVPFLFLALYFYGKGSKKHYYWLMKNKYFSKYILDYKRGKKIPLFPKILFIIAFGLSLAITSTFFVDNQILRVILFIIGILVIIYIIRFNKGGKF
ncbi:hypothetical protein SAMN03080614_10153 [Anaerobranca gottschalkii DSM 13577]|uniref:DUF454 domain-containing protein n=1 Tax=Anaerobranca gottschalkii DSM 13577 TaxID=1120990 RepID=A0A1H9ZYU8_9FIRM|nr:hypothetical protein SAMN03080614_10153 [Anaerobranca gottschalkii DSM 13577]